MDFGQQQSDFTQPKVTTNIEPFIVQTLETMIGEKMVIETSRGSVRGTLADVKPDHIVLKASNTSFIVRIQEIVWIMIS